MKKTLPLLSVLILTACPQVAVDTGEPGPGVERCSDGLDNDGDGQIDCSDSDCDDALACFLGAEDCGDGVDNDVDGLIDDEDPDCGDPPPVEDCFNGIDDDGDGLVDFDDPDCDEDPPPVEDCFNGIDDDGDGLVDFDDPDCDEDPPPPLEDCFNGIDDDGDGLVDFDDPDCDDEPPPIEDCFNGIDDDGDGLVDAEDGDCFDPGDMEICDDGADNDGDGAVDCDDDDCIGPECGGTYRAHVLAGGEAKWVANLLLSGDWCDSQYDTVWGGSMYLAANDVDGELVVDTAAGIQRTCAWHYDSAFHRLDLSVSGYGGGSLTFDQPHRNGFTVDPGCGTSGSAFLPRYVMGMWDLSSGGTGSVRAFDLPNQTVSWNQLFVGAVPGWLEGNPVRTQDTYAQPSDCDELVDFVYGTSMTPIEEGREWVTP